MTAPLYRQLAQLVDARLRCLERVNENGREWAQRHEDRIVELAREHLPSGSGFDNGTKVCLDDSTPNRLVLRTSFHHMDEHGFYREWTDHRVLVEADLMSGFRVRVTGRNVREIKPYIADTFCEALRTEVREPADRTAA